jgi:aconitate hydratase
MGVLPLQFEPGEGWRELGLDGTELYDIEGISEGLTPSKKLRVVAKREDEEIVFNVTAMLETRAEVEYYNNDGILPYVLRRVLARLSEKT